MKHGAPVLRIEIIDTHRISTGNLGSVASKAKKAACFCFDPWSWDPV